MKSIAIKKVKEINVSVIALSLSVIVHIGILVCVGGLMDFSFPENPTPQTQVLQFDKKTAPLLPEIKMIGEFKQLPKASSPKFQNASLNKKDFTQEPNTVELEGTKTDTEQKEAMLRYQDTVKQRIESNRFYPMRALRSRLQGVVDMAFVINADGTSRDIRILRSSGSKFLDAQAMENIRKSSPFLPLPEENNKRFVDIRVAIVFSLQ